MLVSCSFWMQAPSGCLLAWRREMLIELLGTLVFLATVAGALGVVIALVCALVARRRRLIRAVLIGSAIWIATYGVVLVGASLLTPQRVLEPRQERCFDEMCFSA